MYKEKIICDVCGQTIDMPNARIEWNYSGNEMQICHHECSHGMKNDTIHLSDIILDQGLYTEEMVKERLKEIAEMESKYVDKCTRIIRMIFI